MENQKMRHKYIVILTVMLISTTAFAADHVLIIGGTAGEKSFYDAFWSATSRFHELLIDEYGYTQEQITFLFEDMGGAEASGIVDTESKREQVLAAFAELAETVQSSDRFLLFMLGHASRTGRGDLKFNLRGPDITEAEYITLINAIPAERQILIFGFPYSGKLVPQLSKSGRIILTSSSPNEGYSVQAGFGNFFVDAFFSAANDTDRNGDISLLEAFLSLQTRTKDFYEKDGKVQSEHPHLDDNGDRDATRNLAAVAEETDDGALAEKTFLGTRRSALQSPPPEPEVLTDAQSPESRKPPIVTDGLPTVPSETDEPKRKRIQLNPDGSISPVPSRENRRSSLPYNFISEADEQSLQDAIDKLPAQEASLEDGAVILWDSVDINIDEKSRYIYSTRRVAKIFNEDGKGLAEVSIPYMRGRDDVTIHHARTLTPDGEVIELDTNEIIRDVPPPSAVDAGLYVDARLMYFTLPKVSDGCIIDYAYSTNNLGHVMQGEFWRQVYFQGEHPVQYYRFTVHIPKKKQLYYQVSGAPAAATDSQSDSSFLDIEPTMTESNYTRTYTFEARDVPPLKDEYLMPAPQDLAYNISISSLDSWDELATWYATLIREQDEITPKIEEKTKQLLSGAWSRKEKVKRLYEYVATNIQYLGFELGIWAIKPYPADFVLEVGKGDCKDKTTLLSTMLASAGINAYPVLISAGDMRGVNAHLSDGGAEVEAVPSLAYFNHMILVVEGDKDDDLIWLDPTAETCAFGDLPAGDQDRWTLIINPRFLTEDKDPEQETGDIQNELYRFQKSPSLDATSNLKRVHTDVKVKKDLSVSVRQELTVTGSFNMRLRSQLRHFQTVEEKSEFLHKALELDARAKVEDFKVSNLSELEGELKVELTWSCKEYLYAIGSQFVLELPLVKHPYAELLSEERRMYPAAIGKALTLEDKITVSTEAPFKIDIVPEEQALKTDVAEIQLRYAKSKRKAEMHQTIRFLTPRVTPDYILHLKDVVRIASNRGTKRFILTQEF
ncbi:MAG: DUF3857 and transglutaminase domain-containing protein [Candidatus Poribacteria bacterium]|nr:DUF3857 and transglutaminase domain-containing protein [Candidatus Poribacteria bacterium]